MQEPVRKPRSWPRRHTGPRMWLQVGMETGQLRSAQDCPAFRDPGSPCLCLCLKSWQARPSRYAHHFIKCKSPVEMKELSIQSSVGMHLFSSSPIHCHHHTHTHTHTHKPFHGKPIISLREDLCDLNWRLRDKLHLKLKGVNKPDVSSI